MFRRSRLVLVLAVMTIAVLVLTACGGSQSGGTQSGGTPSGGSSAKTVELTFWHSFGADTVPHFEKIAAEFTAKNPNIKVKAVRVPGSETDIQKLMAAVSAGTGPDIYLLDRFTAAQRAEAGVLEDLGPHIAASNFDMNQFFDYGKRECTWKGKTWCLPWSADTRMLYYNKKHFREAGLDPEKPPKTIEELDQYIEKLTKKEGGKIVRYGMIPWRDQGWHYTWGWAFGAKFYDEATQKVLLDEPAFIKSLEWTAKYSDMVGKVLDPWAGQTIDGGPFVAETTSMTISTNGHINTILRLKPDLEYGVAHIPTAPGVKGPVTWSGGWSVVIPKGSKNPKEAFEFMKFFAIEGKGIYIQAYPWSMPAAKKLVETHPKKDDPTFKAFLDLLPVTNVRPPLPVGALLWDELTLARDAVVTGQKSPAQAAKDAQAKVQAELDKVLKKN